MKIPGSRKRFGALTLIEVLVVLAALMVLAAIFLPSLANRNTRSPRIQCVNNLKQAGVAARVWLENGDKYPMTTPEKNGGSMESSTGPNAWRHFQVMSNELSTPKVVICPSETDRFRFAATSFTWFNNSNVSFLVGVDANESLPQAILFGDHNLTNGLPLNNAILEVTSNRPVGWTTEVHRGCGNLCFADGSVRLVNNVDLRNIIASTELATNRLQMPVIKP